MGGSDGLETDRLSAAERRPRGGGRAARHYYMTGATWSIGGASTNSNSGDLGNAAIVNSRLVGTSQLSNTTHGDLPAGEAAVLTDGCGLGAGRREMSRPGHAAG